MLPAAVERLGGPNLQIQVDSGYHICRGISWPTGLGSQGGLRGVGRLTDPAEEKRMLGKVWRRYKEGLEGSIGIYRLFKQDKFKKKERGSRRRRGNRGTWKESERNHVENKRDAKGGTRTATHNRGYKIRIQ